MTSTRSTIAQSWEHWWFRPVPPHALACVRIAIGSFLLVYAGLYAPHISVLFAREGVALPLYEGIAPGWLSWLIVAPHAAVAWGIYAALIAGIAGLLLGWHMRAALITILLTALWFWQLQLHLFPGTFNRLLFFCMIVLLWSGADRTFSLRMYREHGSLFAWEPVSILPQRFLALQITFTFLGVGWQKLWLPDWQSGEILAYSFISRWGTPLGLWFARLPLTLWAYDVVVRIVTLCEVILPFLFWVPRLRLLAIVSVSLFLVLIAVMLGIWWFLFLIPACIVFVPPEDLHHRFFRWFPRRVPVKPASESRSQ